MKNTSIKNKVGQRIKELRQDAGKSQESFALDAGLDRTYIASVEAGRRNISIENLEKIWHALGVSASDFFNCDYFNEGK